MNQKELLKLFNKYGFQSLKKDPFLYAKNEKVGIVYTLKTSYYGALNRIFIPKTKEEAEDFLAKYYWFKKNQNKNLVRVELKEYNTMYTDIKYLRKEKELSKEELLDLKEENHKKEKKESKTEAAFLKKIKRTFLILIDVIEEKINIQNITYQNLTTLTNEFIEKENELNEKLSELKQESFQKKEKITLEPLQTEYQNALDSWKQTIKELNEKESIEKSIKELVEFLQSLELDEGLLKNKYELIKLPLEINNMKERIKELNNIPKKKKGIFRKKENIQEILEKIDKKNAIDKIVSYEHYKENEELRIKEKYALIPNLDIRTIGDFFIEFDNLKIKEPEINEQEEKKEENATYEETMKQLEINFANRPKEEQEMLLAYEYIIKNVLTGGEEERKTNIQEFINTLENPNNIMIKVKYFKDINLKDLESCINSMKTLEKKVTDLKPDNLLGNINIFWKDNRKREQGLIKASNKRLLAPTQNIGENNITYIGELKKDSKILFIPEEIKKDYLSGDTLIIQKNRPFFLVDLEKNELEEENSVIIKVNNYEISKCEEKKVTKAELIQEVVTLYKRVKIERSIHEKN